VLRYDSVGVRYAVLGYWSDQYAMMHEDQRSVTRESNLSKGGSRRPQSGWKVQGSSAASERQKLLPGADAQLCL
jgi:hypothetical protein